VTAVGLDPQQAGYFVNTALPEGHAAFRGQLLDPLLLIEAASGWMRGVHDLWKAYAGRSPYIQSGARRPTGNTIANVERVP